MSWYFLNVPCRIGRPAESISAPLERGKNSYQEPNSASGRSTQIFTGSEAVTSSRIGSAVSTGHISVDSAGPMRSGTERKASRSASMAALIALAYRCLGRAAILSSSNAPVSRSLAISSPDWPAPDLASTACRQVPSGSLQASTCSVHRPCRSGTTVASYFVLQDACLAIRSSGPASLADLRRRVPGGTGGRHTTLAATASCPSRNTLTETVITSPTTALAG